MAAQRTNISIILWGSAYTLLCVEILLHLNISSVYGNLVAVAALFFLGVFLYRADCRHTNSLIDEARNKVHQQFQKIVLNANDERYSFQGETAIVVDDKETLYMDMSICSVTLTRYARNLAGEYFMLIIDGESELYCKHLDHKTARFVLKEKYVSPSDQV